MMTRSLRSSGPLGWGLGGRAHLPGEDGEAEEGHEVAEDPPPGVEREAQNLLVSRGHEIDGEFEPTFYGFNGFKIGLKPADFVIKASSNDAGH